MARSKHEQKRRRTTLQRFKRMKQCQMPGCKTVGKLQGYQLQFDHIDPASKLNSNTSAVNINWKWDKIKRELSKCRVVCANCHMEITWGKNNV